MHTTTDANEIRTSEPVPAPETAAPNKRRSSKAVTAFAWIAPLAVLLSSAARTIADSYPFELLCHFQLQYFIASAVMLLLLLALRRWRAAVLAGTALIVSGSALAPLWFKAPNDGAPAHVGPTARLRILHANVLSSNEQSERLIDLIAQEQPDVLALYEINARWIEALAVLANDYPYREGAQREDDFGILVLSRTRLQGAAVRRLGSSRVPSVTFRTQMNDETVQLVVTHTMPPMSLNAQTARDDQLKQIAAFAKTQADPLIIVGDLNTTMWSPSHRSLCRELGLTNTRRGFGILPSWPVSLPALMRIPIDHCLISDGTAVLDCRLGPDIGSDHLPLIIELASTGG